MMQGWVRGVVKAVISGDTVVIMGAAKGGPPPEKQLTLSSLKAPRLGRRDGATKDDPFAWQSKEYLRKKCIGKSCVFRVDYRVEQLGNREFGTIFLEKENVARSVVSEGWAKVNPVGQQRSPYIEELEKAQASAEQSGLGLWTKDEAAIAASVREMPSEELDVGTLFTQTGKGKPISGIVEQVLNGSLLRVTLLPSFHSVLVAVAGIQSPSMGRRTTGENGEQGQGQPEPFALQAKHFTECKTLCREVRVVLEGADKYILMGSVLFPVGDELVDLGQELVKGCLAKIVESRLKTMITGSSKLRELERAAKLAKRGIWTNYVPQNTNSAKLSDRFTGTVVEVVSGDTVVILDKASKSERRVQLSSLRAPRMGAMDRNPDAWGVDAKEFLRKRIIGKEVSVQMEYTRKITAQAGGPPLPAGRSELAFGNVTYKEKGEMKNVSLMVVEAGFAGLVTHRSDEERSGVYEQLAEAERKAKDEKKGMHTGKAAPIHRKNDVSAPSRDEKRNRFVQRAQGYLPFLQRAQKVRGVVEYVLSGHKVKLYIPRENVTIGFAPTGVKTPQRAQPARGQMPATEGEPYGDEAVAFTREHVNQRDVDVVVETMDRGGTFLGTLTVPGQKPVDLGLALVENGLARLHPSFDPSRPGGRQLVVAENAAKESRLKIWEDYVEGEPAGANEENSGDANAQAEPEVCDVTVTEVVDGSTFFVQKKDDAATMASITEQMTAFGTNETPATAPPPPKGSPCIAKFTVDNQWYRGYVQGQRDGQYDVYFIDYGNSEVLPAERVRAMEPGMSNAPPQANLCQLAYIRVPSLENDDDYSYDSARELSALLLEGSGNFQATIVGREKAAWGSNKHPKTANPKMLVVIKETGGAKSINGLMLEAGLAHLPRLTNIHNPAIKKAVQDLQPHEDVAKKLHKGLFMYGDCGDSDEEDLPPIRGRR